MSIVYVEDTTQRTEVFKVDLPMALPVGSTLRVSDNQRFVVTGYYAEEAGDFGWDGPARYHITMQVRPTIG